MKHKQASVFAFVVIDLFPNGGLWAWSSRSAFKVSIESKKKLLYEFFPFMGILRALWGARDYKSMMGQRSFVSVNIKQVNQISVYLEVVYEH